MTMTDQIPQLTNDLFSIAASGWIGTTN